MFIPQRLAKRVEYPIVATFVSRLSVALGRLLKALNFRVFGVVIFARIWHPFIDLTLAAVSFT